MGDVGDDPNVELARINSMLGPAMRGRFQDCMGQASPHHLLHVALDIMGIRRGNVKASVHLIMPNYGIDRGNQSGAYSRLLKNSVDEVRRGGLPVRASHAYHTQAAPRPAMICRRDVAQGLPGAGQSNIWHGQALHFAFSDNCRRTPGDGVGDIVVPIGGTADERHEHITRLDTATVNGNASDLGGRNGGIQHAGWQAG